MWLMLVLPLGTKPVMWQVWWMIQGMSSEHQQLLYHPDNFSIFIYWHSLMWLYYKQSLLISEVYCTSKKYRGKRTLILAHPMKLWELDPTFRAPPVLNLSFVNQLFFCFYVRKICAFDSDRKRLAVMQTLMKKAGVECVTMANCSFLEVSNPVFIEHLNCKASGTRKETS